VETFWSQWLGVQSADEILHMLVKLLVGMGAGALIGTQRQHSGKPAGLRTHVLVALGTTTFVVAAIDMGHDALSRVIQGIAAGIGFLGAGNIIKHPAQPEIIGLTTAASIWMAAGVGIAAGLGEFALAVLGALLTWFTLTVLLRLERHIDSRVREQHPPR
jgi:putative Mg2+ transporter-C (MgtC) family protein